MPSVKKQSAKRKRRPKQKSATDLIQPLGEDGGGLTVNIYGRSGTGKTTLWATFPKPILAIICSGGSQPGELRSIDTPANRKSISKAIISDIDEFSELVEYQAETGKFKTVVLDHATGLQDFTLKSVLDLDQVPEQLSWGLASQQQYGQVALQMKERLRSLLNLSHSCNVVIVAQEREFNADSDNDLIMPNVASALTPSVTGWLNPACDYIVNTFIRQKMVEKKVKIGGKTTVKKTPGDGVEYCLRVGPHEVYTTKFRIPKERNLPNTVVDPSYDKLIKLIRGS